MQYYEYTFAIEPYSEAASDVLAALLADEGFETFVTEEQPASDTNALNASDRSASKTKTVLKAYIQQSLCHEEGIQELINQYPLPDTCITYTVAVPEDKDWNEDWEQHGFEPITIGHELVVCDTKHVDSIDTSAYAHCLLIHPRQAFGTGSHQTTRMLLTTLLTLPVEGKSIIDAGCGTGILGFLCLQRGAAHVLAYDIDDWSTHNAADNAKLNFTEEKASMASTENTVSPIIPELPATLSRLEIRLGDSSCIASERNHDILIANINRNILLGDMERFAAALKPAGSTLLLSGFYQSDVPTLLAATTPLGFQLTEQHNDGDWAMLVLNR